MGRISYKTGLAAACVAIGFTAAPPAAADPACDSMFKLNRDFLNYDHRNYTSVLWSTTYLTDKVRYMGTTMMPMRVERGELVAAGTRTRTFEYPNDRERHAETEAVSITIRADGKVMLSKIYGPYEPACIEKGAVGYMILKPATASRCSTSSLATTGDSRDPSRPSGAAGFRKVTATGEVQSLQLVLTHPYDCRAAARDERTGSKDRGTRNKL